MTAETRERAIDSEELLTIREARAEVQRITRKRLALSTLYRWVTEGVHGVRLEVVRVGREKMTSAGALRRFFRACAEADRGSVRRTGSFTPFSPGPFALARRGRSARQRKRDIERAERFCAKRGI